MPRLSWVKDIGSSHMWAVTGIWLFLAFFCYEMMRQQADRLYQLADVVQKDVERPRHGMVLCIS
jgi:hypothetical protein